MKNQVLVVLGIAFLTACGTSMKLAVPETFRQQATMQHVAGARGNKMSFANFSTSKIKRGAHVSYPGWGRTRGFFLENLVLNKVGVQVGETIENEKAKFRYTITDGKNYAAVYAREKQVTKKLEIEMTRYHGLFSSFEQLQHYNYVFSAWISADTTQDSKDWELMMTNIYDREAERDPNPFTFIKQQDAGLATNGRDTLFIHPLSLRKTELSNGKTGQLPFKLLSGYELSTSAGVVAIVDLIDRNIWFYNELDPAEKLNISAIGTAILARKVNDAKW
ncbi:hypothetical protein [Chitinophaga vietnamensis]|uniref:hypothetical protein n=1 Tax=Chitinophaga vietnamensis TaxID=2593957 RepID=UPI0011777725|nr:hypothetical protein [Chitinophaga vietnamensis]